MSDSKVNHLSHIPIYRKIHSHLLPFFVSLSMVIIIAVLLTGCGTSPGNTDSGTTDNNVSNIIGSAGGTVTSSNGKVKIVIPSGALNKDTDITVSAVSNQPSGNIGTAYEVEPDGTTFNKLVTISIIYDEASLPSGVSESDIKLGTVINNQWEVITDSSVNIASNTISGSITHLSTYGIMAVNTGSVPAVPTGIAATAGDGKVIISWDTVSGATSYNIYWSTTSGVTKTSGTKIAGVTTPYPHTGRNNGTTYYYVVTAVNSYGESSESSQVSVTPTSGGKSDTTSPTITSTSPANNAVNVGVTSSITATFSEIVVASTINTATFTLNNGITGAASLTGTGVTATFTPTNNLAYNTTYTATITTGVTDIAGNPMSSNFTWSFTTESAPVTAPSAPAGVTATAGDGQATISWVTASGATSYNLYWSTTSGVTKTTGTKLSNATSPYIHTGLPNGTTYYYVVTAVNSYGESGESVQVSAKPVKPDITPPDTSITDKPSSLSNLTSASFSFSSTETDSTFQCQIDNGGYSSCISPKVYTGLTDGSHTFEVKSTDASGNTDLTSANYTWVIDATSPSNTTGSNFINSGSTSTNSTTVTLSISATDNAGITGYYASEASTTPSSSVSGWTSVSPTTDYSAGVTFTLSNGEGTKTVYVWFKDEAGNISASASDTLTLDTVPPDTSITSQPSNPSNSTSPSFSFTSAEAGSTFKCQLDNAGYSACTSPKSYTGLTDGNHTCEVKATDFAGNTDSTPASYTWKIDVIAPTNISSSNFINSGAASTNTATVMLTISATDNTGITAYYASEASTIPSGSDSGWTSVSSTTSYSAGVTFTLNSGDGTKTVYVWFRDAAGNISSVVSDSITLGSPPITPTGVKATVSDGQATISWDAVSNAASYNIYWSTTSGTSKSTGTQILNVLNPYTHTGMANGTAYYYVVTAVNDFGESVESTQVLAIPQAPISLPKTGQTTCYDRYPRYSSIISCTGTTGQDGDLQKGATWPNPRFSDNGDGTMTDNLTGLMWTKTANTPGPPICVPDVTRSWQDTLDYIVCLNTNKYLGYTDWRMPNINEIASLLNFGQSDPGEWLYTQGFNGVNAGYLWSSTTYVNFTYFTGNMAWVGKWGDTWGDTFPYSKSENGHVWPVRSGRHGIIQILRTGQTICYNSAGNVIACTGTGQDGDIQAGAAWPLPRFTGNGDYTVTDNLTGLVWTKNGNAPGPASCSSISTYTWEGALDYVACLNTNSYLGYTDWRLPNVNEIKSLVNFGQSDPGAWLNIQGFSNVQLYSNHAYWSSTTNAHITYMEWMCSMWDGDLFAAYKSGLSGSYYYVWPVRSGQ